MKAVEWILLDTKTTGISPPIFVVEIAAQTMRGWEPLGEPFRKLLNQNQDIAADASRVHRYTREVLERDGEPPHAVYQALAAYAGSLPLVSYDLEHDLDQVLTPEWRRLNIAPFGAHGFCALRLVQRLLDPVPAGSCKLESLRQYYRLPDREADTALGDVMTVADLFTRVLRPIAEERGIDTWGKVVQYAGEEWYPSRLSFGKFKGQPFQDADRNPDLRKWLDLLAGSSNAKSASMGRWYLRELETRPAEARLSIVAVRTEAPTHAHGPIPGALQARVVIYVHPDLERFRELVAAARTRLADLQAAYTSDKANVSALQARLFERLRPHFEERDRLRLIVNYRQIFLDTLLKKGEDEAHRVQQEYQEADTRRQREYEGTAKAMEGKHHLTTAEDTDLKSLWKKLVKLFHPDRFADDLAKLDTYTKLTSAINAAKDSGDVETLRQIAQDPVAYVLRQGWTAIDFGDSNELVQLQRLLASLELEIIAVIEATTSLKESADYELYRLTEANPKMLDRVVEQQVEGINKEVAGLKSQAERLKHEIEELTGDASPFIG